VVNQGEDFARVQLTQGRWAKVDIEDIDLVSGKRWKFSAGYAYCREDSAGPIVLMHRLILGLKPYGPPCDHANHDGLDNRRSNIRPCTPSQNQANRHKRPGFSSVHKGVSWNPCKMKWQFSITVEGQRSPFVYFDSEEEAARAYNAAALAGFGEFAVLNQV
jgi:hypothetical protein